VTGTIGAQNKLLPAGPGTVGVDAHVVPTNVAPPAQITIAPSSASITASLASPTPIVVSVIDTASDVDQVPPDEVAPPAPITLAPALSPYVTVQKGHLYRNGKRLRQWGVNLQTGYFLTYAEIDLLIARLQGLGFNALRVWPTNGTFYVNTPDGPVPATAKKGDGSALDRYDYLVYKAAQAGMTLQLTALHYLDLPTLREIRDPTISAWVAAAKDDAQLRNLHGFAPYVSTGYRNLLKQHIATQLSRVNPYTARRYADEPSVSAWELANEAHFVDCALTPTCLSGLPTIAFEALSSRWQSSKLNLTKLPLPADTASFIAGATYPAFAEFIAQTFVSGSGDLRAHARSVGGPASGVAVQPFIFNTGPTSPNAVAHFAYSRGDVFSIGAYRSPLQDAGALEGSAWLPVTAGGTKLPTYLNHVKVEGKPMIVYETSFFRPFSYRAEWGPLMVAMALQQDWDGVFLYQYGQPNAIYTAGGKPEGYGTMPLPEPSAYSPSPWKRDYTYGFHHGGDPVAMGSWSIAARLFTPVTESSPLQRTWRLPLRTIYSRPAGYPAGYFDAAWSAAWFGSVAIAFVGDDKSSCSPCLLSTAQPKSFAVQWPTPERQTLIVETPAGRAVTGALSGDLGQMGDGIKATIARPGFGIAAVLRSGSSRDAEHSIQVVGEVSNSGMLFDRNRVNYASPIGAIYGLEQQGAMPLEYKGPAVDFQFPSAVTLAVENFGLQSAKLPGKSTTTRFAAEADGFRIQISP
jgi:hypothetical protein